MEPVYAAPLIVPFRGLETRTGLLLRGAAGWGEFAPFEEYDDQECRPWWRSAAEAAEQGWPTPLRTHIPVNVTVPAVDPVRAAQLVHDSGGCRTAKIKVAQVGEDPARERDRVAAVRDALGPGGRIRLDANGGWDVDTALERLRVLDRVAGGLEYVEQPCATVAELAQVRRRGPVRVAADESIRRSEDPLAVVRAEAADIAVIKVAPLGGVRAALRIVAEAGLPAVVSSALESAVGISAGLALAACLPELPFACGLATGNLFKADVSAQKLRPQAGLLPVGAISPDPVHLADLAAPPATQTWWRARAQRVRELEATA